MSQDLRPASLERLPVQRAQPARTAQAASREEGDRLLRAGRNAPLTCLCDALDAIFEACAHFPEPSDSTFFARSMRIALANAAASPDLLTAAQREGSVETYRRHLLAADPRGRYAIAALVWLPQQASPVHAHHTWCGYAVLDGTLSETIFEWNGAQHCASATRTQARSAGAVSFVRGGRGGIHQLGNRSDSPAVSLHIYGVAGAQIATHVNDIVRAADAQALA
ncbi:cysteine dioxygenase family protein [Paraburkholderia sp. FT54]|uniref:cysteine dioxygenase family protein n=1 Tax=Paraburkholderia sp. FT54 TaxID=3074437 RepID=UPI0028777099|nr:cysteine dioxygenase family protein [Paraburkholderia sp. FT54]WNC88449.1 cysteine dioxygenase family protein [Paraburkholderia sp. FT54]